MHDTNACRAEGYDVKDMCKHCGRKEVICTYGKQHFNKTIVEDACGGDSGGMIAKSKNFCLYNSLTLLNK